jgi:hypothetical protein
MSRVSFPLVPAIIGFSIGMALCGYTFYLTSHNGVGNLLFLVFCPPSILSMALDNAGVVGGIVGWLFISFANAGLYAVIGKTIQTLYRSQRDHHE